MSMFTICTRTCRTAGRRLQLVMIAIDIKNEKYNAIIAKNPYNNHLFLGANLRTWLRYLEGQIVVLRKLADPGTTKNVDLMIY